MSSPSTTCTFNGCTNAALVASSKCTFHKHRSHCIIPQCTNQVYARQRCVRHGGRKVCGAADCNAHVSGGGFCPKHGGHTRKRLCTAHGCSKQAHANQKCVRHGGGRYCQASGCAFHARLGGFCHHHNQDLIPHELDTTKQLTPLDGIDVAILQCLVAFEDFDGGAFEAVFDWNSTECMTIVL
ncbi:Aste57867_23692 [Aphanomyces stellatus]|uniref:Aste57867_23692 protein n=1 Tax=Aphanomyces stellatus TaxID=120398 RepID=A0A485LQ11_9STRA|nr:hypothetical protein As57867_023620 [Aphanomyces stellatus]VFU00337.1 Aste57867_23692 [Aphanomyces stellatus]